MAADIGLSIIRYFDKTLKKFLIILDFAFSYQFTLRYNIV